jgi:hypothetical protein
MDKLEALKGKHAFNKIQHSINEGSYERRRLFPNTNPGNEFNSGLYMAKNLGQPATNFIGCKSIKAQPENGLQYAKRRPWNIHESGIPVLRTRPVAKQYSVNC